MCHLISLCSMVYAVLHLSLERQYLLAAAVLEQKDYIRLMQMAILCQFG